MEITWLGHSCFLIRGKEKAIITDPCHPDLGYRLGEPNADIVTLSHSHPGHNYIEGVANDPKQIKSPGEYEIGGTFITGLASFHDNRKGDLRGKNTIYIIEMDAITLCHLGDLGHPLDPHLIEEIGDIDILFLPVGEVSTMPIDTAVEVVRHLEPPIVIPMHYKTEAFTGNLSLVDKFLDKMRIRGLEPRPKLSITSSSLPSSTQIIVLNYLQTLNLDD
jgi:L-ascorbate metabolism protein UlaG (beta-lactamase superfamily)